MRSSILAVIPFYFGNISFIVANATLLARWKSSLLIVDNSKSIKGPELSNFHNITIYTPLKNIYLNGAYLFSFQQIQKSQHTHLLLLDQDSLLSDNLLCSYHQSIDQYPSNFSFAAYDRYNKVRKDLSSNSHLFHSTLLDCKGSGFLIHRSFCLPNLIDSNLILDYLDWSLCWKLRKFPGFHIYQLTEPLQSHTLGKSFFISSLPSLSFRISSLPRLINQFLSSIYLLFSPSYFFLLPLSRRLKFLLRLFYSPLLILFSLFISILKLLRN